MLQTGERTDYSANTIHRDPTWRKKDRNGYLRMHQSLAAELGVADGETVQLITEHGRALVATRVTDDIHPGNQSMPHGYGLLWENEQTGALEPVGTNVQELVSAKHRDPHTGIPLHKYMPAAVKKGPAWSGRGQGMWTVAARIYGSVRVVRLRFSGPSEGSGTSERGALA